MYSVQVIPMGVLFKLVGGLALIIGLQLINIYVVNAASVDINNLIETMDYEPPNEGGPDSSQGSGTR